MHKWSEALDDRLHAPRNTSAERQDTSQSGEKEKVHFKVWIRTTDLWVMGPARYLCATLNGGYICPQDAM